MKPNRAAAGYHCAYTKWLAAHVMMNLFYPANKTTMLKNYLESSIIPGGKWFAKLKDKVDIISPGRVYEQIKTGTMTEVGRVLKKYNWPAKEQAGYLDFGAIENRICFELPAKITTN